ncbi:MAG: peptide MFS transporter [Sphingomonadales bacterium]|nr:peptide MFS transporter [Sphingomonadales bacterium]MBD3774096.1 peptide MFS transporter [Paracoccaceae bacterium]
MTSAEATPAIEPEAVERMAHDTAFLGHPKGLGYLGFVEGCERFSYYSMQTLLVLYMTNYLLLPAHSGGVIGLPAIESFYGLSGQPLASRIFGNYTSLVYLTPILGGILADRWLGRRAALIAGGLVMSLGHFLMAIESMFFFALLSLIVGVGLFKGNIASQVGELYGENDNRRAMAFQIFYIFINVSVIVAPLTAGSLGQDPNWGWHYGFGLAGVVMVIGLLIYLKALPWLPADNIRKGAGAAPREKVRPEEWPRLIALLLLVPVLGVALLTNQEIFNAYLVWADQKFTLTLFGIQMYSSWMITIDAAVSFSMLVAVAAFWAYVGKRTGKEPDELGKMIIGSGFTVAGGLCLYMGAVTAGDGKVTMFWPLMFHLLNSIGFAHILPVSLALFTKLAPRALNATVVGIYYLAFVLANYVVGEIGGWYSSMDTASFWLVHVASAAVGLVAFVLFKLIYGRQIAAHTAAS